MKPLVSIIIPTYDNVSMLVSALNSIGLSLCGPMKSLTEIIVVNNGAPGLSRYVSNVKVIETGRNLGWEGGLNDGLKHSEAPYVLFANDDIRLIPGRKDWLWNMMATFNDPAVGAVGPCSNFVAGPQNNFVDVEDVRLEVKYLIGFFILIKREALNKAGGVHEGLPGGDDIDLSIRLRDAGYKLICRRDVYVHHHGQATGNRVRPGYWDSQNHQDATNNALIRKHGMLKFWETWVIGYVNFKGYSPIEFADTDIEGDLCRMHVQGEKILELGCGGKKTVPLAVGVDLINPGAPVPFVAENSVCQADLQSDVSVALPVPDDSQDCIIARHLLEHCHDTVGTLAVWNRALKKGGRLVLAVPNHELGNVVMQNPEHVAAITPRSLRNAAVVAGFAEIYLYRDVNGVSFVAVYEKYGPPHWAINSPVAAPAPHASRLEECYQ